MTRSTLLYSNSSDEMSDSDWLEGLGSSCHVIKYHISKSSGDIEYKTRTGFYRVHNNVVPTLPAFQIIGCSIFHRAGVRWLKLPAWRDGDRLRGLEVACSAADRKGSNLESCVWRTVSSESSHHPQEVLLAQFSLYVHKGGLKPALFHFLHCLLFSTLDVVDV